MVKIISYFSRKSQPISKIIIHFPSGIEETNISNKKSTCQTGAFLLFIFWHDQIQNDGSKENHRNAVFRKNAANQIRQGETD